jgi:hypothetical protein
MLWCDVDVLKQTYIFKSLEMLNTQFILILLFLNYANTCSPVAPCRRNIYDSSFEPWKKNTVTNGSALRIQLASPNVQYIEDSRSYDEQSLIDEVGGTLGLLLGLSFFSIFDFFA